MNMTEQNTAQAVEATRQHRFLAVLGLALQAPSTPSKLAAHQVVVKLSAPRNPSTHFSGLNFVGEARFF